MFYGCTGLTTAPELPATTLASECYYQMFYRCINLTTAPELPAITLTPICYHSMFYGCTKLNLIKCLATDISASNCTTNWVNGVAVSGTFIKDPTMENWTTGNNGIPSGWNVKHPDTYLTFNITNGGDITWTGSTSNVLSYSTDNGESWSTASSNITLSVNEGDKVLWKGVTTPQSWAGIGRFGGDTNVRYTVEGNVMSLLFGDNFKGQISLEGKDYALYNLFYGNRNITSAENLLLPATTLVTQCYSHMFYNCTSLTTAPELPATTLADYCYSDMFYGCTSLNSIKCLATDISETGCTTNWVRGVPPYEAEIEYLESTGTQYIDTGVLMNTLTDEMRLEYLITNKNNFCGVAGARLGASSRSVTVAYNGNISSIDCNNSNYTISRAEILDNQINIRYTAISSITRRGLYQGATVLATNNNYSDVFTSNSIYVFAVNGINNKASIRLYNFTIKSNTTKIDLIPVRIGQVGYMYDKVSGQLFGNAGTGNFVLGNDVKVNTFIKDSSMEDWTTGNNGIPNGWAIQNV